MKYKKIINYLLIMFVSFFGASIATKAETVTNKFKETFIAQYSFIDTTGHYGNFEYFQRVGDNHIAYCIQPGVSLAKNTNYQGYYGLSNEELASKVNLSPDQLIKVSQIAHYGWGYNGHYGHHWIVATQALIWNETGRSFQFTSRYLPDPNDPYKYVIDTPPEVQEAMNEIQILVENHYNQPTFSTYNANISYGSNYTFHDQGNALSNYHVNYCENCNASIQGSDLVVSPNSVSSGYVSLKKENNAWTQEFIVYHSDKGQDVLVPGNLDPVQFRVNFNVISGTLNLKKYDRDTNQCTSQGQAELSGAVYGLYKSNGELFKEITIDENCSAVVDHLPIDNFYLQEIKAPKGYKKDNTRYSVQINENQTEVSLNLTDEVYKTELQINKTYLHESGVSPEAGAVFEIRQKSDNKLITTLIIDESGLSKTILPYGEYIIKQIKGKNNYMFSNDIDLNINENVDEKTFITLLNKPIEAKLKLIKVDSDSKKVILFKGTRFKIKNLSTNEYVCQSVTYPSVENICEFETDATGTLITPYPLLMGTYALEEISSPNGYYLNTNQIIFNVDRDSMINGSNNEKYIEVQVENEKIKGKIQIEKKGEFLELENNNFSYIYKNLKDVEFSLYANEDIITLDGIVHYHKGELVAKSKTNEFGIAIFDSLNLGSYIVKETKTGTDYILNSKEYVINLTANDNQTKVVTENLVIKNQLKKGKLHFTKTDFVTGEVIPNTLLEIYTDKDELVFSGRTDNDGVIEIDSLRVGKYYIIEKEPSTGYVITDEKVYFEIKENGKVVKAKMKNKPITGTLEFTKTDISTGEPLSNTLIEIYNDKDELIFNGRTDENGKIIIPEIRYGKYYILEKEAPEGYILNPERMYFEILEEGKVVKATMVNEKVIVEVPNTELNRSLVAEAVGTFLLLLGLGVVIYEQKK